MRMKIMMSAAVGVWILLTSVGQAAETAPLDPLRQQQRSEAQDQHRQAAQDGAGNRGPEQERNRNRERVRTDQGETARAGEDGGQRYGSGFESRQRGAGGTTGYGGRH